MAKFLKLSGLLCSIFQLGENIHKVRFLAILNFEKYHQETERLNPPVSKSAKWGLSWKATCYFSFYKSNLFLISYIHSMFLVFSMHVIFHYRTATSESVLRGIH